MANQYDRIFKENIEPVIPYLAKKVFGIEIPKTEEIKDKIQITLEGETDFLKKVLHEDSSEDFILQIEFQAKDDRNMVSRMLLYRAFLYHKYRLPVKQFVFYVGVKTPKMETTILQEGLIFNFNVRSTIDFDYEIFLNSDQPEEVVLAILSNFKNHEPKEVIVQIFSRLEKLLGFTQRLKKYARQLEVLSKLRNLQEETAKQIDIMPFIYDLETDVRFLQGQEKGIEKGIEKNKIENATKMLQSGHLSFEQISNFSGLSLEKIQTLAKKLK